MIWKNNKPRAIIIFSVYFFLSYIALFGIFFKAFPSIRENFIFPVLKNEVRLLDPSSNLRSLKAVKNSLQGEIHFEIDLKRHPNGDRSIEQGQLRLTANFTLRDTMLQLFLMLALALSWPGLSLIGKIKALAIVLISWLCFFSLLFPFSILDDGVPPVGVRLTLINWWIIFLAHKGNALLTLLFFIGNMYTMYSLSQSCEPINKTMASSAPTDPKNASSQ